MVILKPVTDEEIKQVFVDDQRRTSGWAVLVTPRDSILANHFKREGAKEMLDRIMSDNPSWSVVYEVYFKLLKKELGL